MKQHTPKLLLAASALALAAIVATPTVRADEGAKAPKEHRYAKKTLEKYDANKDGQLDEQEVAAMKADKKAQREAKKAKKAAEKARAKAEDEK